MFSKLKRNFEYFFTSIQNKIKKNIIKLSKNIPAGINVYFAKKSTTTKNFKKINLDSMKKNVLITGGSGFIGSHVVDALIKNKYKNQYNA